MASLYEICNKNPIKQRQQRVVLGYSPKLILKRNWSYSPTDTSLENAHVVNTTLIEELQTELIALQLQLDDEREQRRNLEDQVAQLKTALVGVSHVQTSPVPADRPAQMLADLAESGGSNRSLPREPDCSPPQMRKRADGKTASQTMKPAGKACHLLGVTRSEEVQEHQGVLNVRIGSSPLSSAKVRAVILHSGYLRFYDLKDLEQPKKIMRIVRNGRGSVIQDIPKVGANIYRFSFHVCFPAEKEGGGVTRITLSAATREEKERWMKALLASASKCLEKEETERRLPPSSPVRSAAAATGKSLVRTAIDFVSS